jgi:hypothetical protein
MVEVPQQGKLKDGIPQSSVRVGMMWQSLRSNDWDFGTVTPTKRTDKIENDEAKVDVGLSMVEAPQQGKLEDGIPQSSARVGMMWQSLRSNDWDFGTVTSTKITDKIENDEANVYFDHDDLGHGSPSGFGSVFLSSSF